LRMQLEHLEVHGVVDQCRDPGAELPAIREEGHQHADGEDGARAVLARQDDTRSDRHDDEALETEDERVRGAAQDVEPRGAYAATAAMVTQASAGEYRTIIASAANAINPSSAASTTDVVNVFWMAWMDPNLDTTSPRWRRSKKSTGNFTMCANTLPSHWRLTV